MVEESPYLTRLPTVGNRVGNRMSSPTSQRRVAEVAGGTVPHHLRLKWGKKQPKYLVYIKVAVKGTPKAPLTWGTHMGFCTLSTCSEMSWRAGREASFFSYRGISEWPFHMDFLTYTLFCFSWIVFLPSLFYPSSFHLRELEEEKQRDEARATWFQDNDKKTQGEISLNLPYLFKLTFFLIGGHSIVSDSF